MGCRAAARQRAAGARRALTRRARRRAFPLRLEPGEEAWLDVPVPEGGLSLRFEGSHVRVSVFGAGELLGRVWLSDSARPRFTGGDAGRILVPASWNRGSVRVLVHGTAGGAAPELSAVLAG